MIDKTKFIVLDVETNGLSSQRDDLLSISIYVPDKEIFYDRFLPLELQTNVLTSEINGITKEMLDNQKSISQEEFDLLIKEYELDRRTILTYGDLDKHFIKAYFKRHKISGFEKLTFKNIKSNIISTSYTNGLLTKDNLCNCFGISGVINVHSGHNDCYLEWKLFEFINNRILFVSYTYEFCPDNVKHKHENWYIYELNHDYIVPVSYFHSHPKLINYLALPKISVEFENVFEYEFSKRCSPKYAWQPAGVASEHLIKEMLNAKNINNSEFLLDNKRKLKYLGSIIAPDIETILYEENKDGTLKAVYKENQKYINAINKQTKALKAEIKPVIEYIKQNIFKNAPILSQELILDNEYKILGLCDFSNEHACLETKWLFSTDNKRSLDEYKYQLYVCSNSRPCYLSVGSENKYIIYKISFAVEK